MITVEDLDAFGYYFYAISLRAGQCECCIKEGFEEIVDAIRATNALKADFGRHQCFGTPCPEKTCHSKWRNMILKLTTTRSLLQNGRLARLTNIPMELTLFRPTGLTLICNEWYVVRFLHRPRDHRRLSEWE
jgi:hypothetical protein